MILCDPFAINTLSLSTVRHLQELVSQETLPRVSPPGRPRAAFAVGMWVQTWGPGPCPRVSTRTPRVNPAGEPCVKMQHRDPAE